MKSLALSTGCNLVVPEWYCGQIMTKHILARLFWCGAASVLSACIMLGAGAISASLNPPVQAATASSTFLYTFNKKGTLQEAGSMGESTSPYFWVNSGGSLVINNDVGSTIMGATSGIWQFAYAANNALDTQNGLYPQNLFRLVTRSTWTNVTQEVDLKIAKINTTNTPNRDGYSGVLLMSRYKDGDNLYYAGVRNDGEAVIKRKKNGVYTTLDQKPVFSGTYNKTTNPSLLPKNTWFRLRSVTKTNSNGSVTITLYIDKTKTGAWEKIAEATDSSPITGAGYAGIRSDYMDLYMDNYRITEG